MAKPPAVEYLHNALGQRVFKSEPQAEQTLPKEEDLGPGFMNWLKKQFGWMFIQGQWLQEPASARRSSMATAKSRSGRCWANTTTAVRSARGRTEYIWLPTEDGSAIPIGMYRNGKFFAIHTDHLGTPRLMTNEENKPVWQWPYIGVRQGQAHRRAQGHAESEGGHHEPARAAQSHKPAAGAELRIPGLVPRCRDEHLLQPPTRCGECGPGSVLPIRSDWIAGRTKRVHLCGRKPTAIHRPTRLSWRKSCYPRPMGAGAG